MIDFFDIVLLVLLTIWVLWATYNETSTFWRWMGRGIAAYFVICIIGALSGCDMPLAEEYTTPQGTALAEELCSKNLGVKYFTQRNYEHPGGNKKLQLYVLCKNGAEFRNVVAKVKS